MMSYLTNLITMIKKLLGIQPQLTADGAYSPSPLSLKLATSAVTDYEEVDYGVQNKDKKHKILMVCAEESNVPMTNGTYFSSGNHPVETLVPMLHLQNAGFEFDVFTANGKPVKLEMWAMPQKDKNVKSIYEKYKSQFDNPKNLADFANNNNFNGNSDYVAIYFPGGHGALLGLPTNKHVGNLIKWAFEKDLFHLSICHGPATLLAAKPTNENEPFIYKGYKLAAFPDKVDRQTPLIGYMPGQLTWFFGEQLEKLGMTIINSKADKTCFADRKLITAASPKAANNFGKLCATELLKQLNP